MYVIFNRYQSFSRNQNTPREGDWNYVPWMQRRDSNPCLQVMSLIRQPLLYSAIKGSLCRLRASSNNGGTTAVEDFFNPSPQLLGAITFFVPLEPKSFSQSQKEVTLKSLRCSFSISHDIGCGDRIWTYDLQLMRLTSYRTALPRHKNSHFKFSKDLRLVSTWDSKGSLPLANFKVWQVLYLIFDFHNHFYGSL